MTLEQQLESALRDARLGNARRINRLRAGGTAAFVITIGLLVYGYDATEWSTALAGTVIYFGIALALMLASEVRPAVLRASRFAIPVFDMPMIFLLQLANMGAAEDKGNVSEFSVSLFVCLIMLSAFTLSAPQIIVSLVLAVAFEQALQFVAGLGIGSHFVSPVIFGVVTWMCVFAGRNRLELIETITHANARRMRLQRYFSPGVGGLLEEQEEDQLALGQECELTVLFTDIRGFTALSSSLTGREVVRLLNLYHTRMVDAVFRHGGTLDKYLGDGLMAYFNAPVGQADHADRAVQCALAMERELAALNADRWWPGGRPLEVGIGIHTGPAIVGDIGAPHRREFTAIGEAVNIAARLEQMTKQIGVRIVVSAATAGLTTDSVAWREIGEFDVRGHPEPMRLLTPENSGGQER